MALVHYNQGTLTSPNRIWVIYAMAAASTLDTGLMAYIDPLMRFISIGYTAHHAIIETSAYVESVDGMYNAIDAVKFDILWAAMGYSDAVGLLLGAKRHVDLQAAWRTVIGLDERIGVAITMKNIDFDPIAVTGLALQVDLELTISIARCLYLYSLWEILSGIPPVAARGSLEVQL